MDRFVCAVFRWDMLPAPCFVLSDCGYVSRKGWAKAFIIIGTNSIVAYTAWHLFDFGLVSDVFTNGLKPFTGNWYPLIRAIGAFTVMFLILRYMYVKRIFVKV